MTEGFEPPVPVRLRPATDRAIGTTAFFRNRPLFDVLLERLRLLGESRYSILFHACSIGAEVYSLKCQYLVGGYDRHFDLDIHATDLEPGFVHFAAQAEYPAAILGGMSSQEAQLFSGDSEIVRPVDAVRGSVEFLDAGSFMDFTTDTTYDVVSLLNALVYVTREEQASGLDRISGYNHRLLLTSAFHASSIRADLERNAYSPVLDRQEEIHDAWTDRRVQQWSEDLAPGIHANWRLPDFDTIDDYEYRYCALFEKHT